MSTERTERTERLTGFQHNGYGIASSPTIAEKRPLIDNCGRFKVNVGLGVLAGAVGFCVLTAFFMAIELNVVAADSSGSGDEGLTDIVKYSIGIPTGTFVGAVVGGVAGFFRYACS